MQARGLGLTEDVAVETYRPTPKQQGFHADPAKIRLLLGAFGAGKTKAIIWETILLALEHKGMLACVFRKTAPALRDTTKADFLNEIPPELVVKEIKSESREALHLLGGSRVWFRPLDDWKKLGSTAFDLAVFDEAYEFDEADFLMVSGGRLRGKVGPRRMILATNPPDESHWLYKHFVQKPLPGYSVHHFSTYDNAENLPPEYIERLETMPAAWKRKYLYGQWGFLAEGEPVYQEYREELHRTTLRFAPNIVIRRGWDPGWQHAACCWVQIMPSGHINILHELLGTKEDFRTFARRAIMESAQRFPRAKFEDYIDIAGLQKHSINVTPIQILKHLGVHAAYKKLPLDRSVESIRYVIEKLHLGRPMLQVDRQCPITSDAFSGGYYMDEKTGQPCKDGKMYEHMMDAVRVAIAPVTMPLFAEAVALPPIRHQRYAC